MSVSRRDFLEKGVQTASALAVAFPAAALISACGQEPLGSPGGDFEKSTVNLANASDGVYSLSFSDHPALQTVGGSVRVNIAASSGVKRLFVTRSTDSIVSVVSSICTHQDCALNGFNQSTQQYLCACHGSLFSVDGAVVRGPAKVALEAYASSITETGIQITVP